MEKRASKGWLAWLILIMLAFVWGSSFILMKRGMFDSANEPIFSDVQVAALRMFLAFVFLIPFTIKYMKELWGKKWLALLSVGLFGNGIPAFLFTAAQQQLDSSYVGMLNSLTPLFTLIIAVSAFKVKVRWTQTTGIVIGLAGALGLILFQGVDTSGDLLRYSTLVVAATLCYAISVNIIRNNLAEVHPIAITGVAFMFIGPATGIYLFSTDFTTILTTNATGWGAFGYIAILAVFGTALAVIIFNQLIKMTSGIFAASVTYLIPIVAIFWGFVDDEPIHWEQIMWSAVILIGVWLVNYNFNKRSRARTEA